MLEIRRRGWQHRPSNYQPQSIVAPVYVLAAAKTAVSAVFFVRLAVAAPLITPKTVIIPLVLLGAPWLGGLPTTGIELHGADRARHKTLA